MKGAKGGNRDRIISWLFSEKTRKKREERLQDEELELEKADEKRHDRRKDKRNLENKPLENEEIVQDVSFAPLLDETVKTSDDKTIGIKEAKEKVEDKEIETFEDDYDLDVTIIDIFDTSRDKKKDKKEEEKKEDKDKPKEHITIIEDVELGDKPKDKVRVDEKPLEQVEISEEVKIIDEVHQVKPLEKPELIKISIIEEIEEILRNDWYDLRDIRYQIEVLSSLEQDEVLLDNVKSIQKELDDLVRRFEEIKRKYEGLYNQLSIKDMEIISGLNFNGIINDYIVNCKEGFDSSKTLDQIKEIQEFIDIINNIIVVEKGKDDLNNRIEEKKEVFGVRDEEFIKLQDRYANVDLINAKVEQYNLEMTSVLLDIELKVSNSVDVTKRMQETVSLVPDVNKIMQATIMIASTKLIPPTPLGGLFKATLFASAAHMIATAITPQVETKEITTVTVADYSRDIKIGQDSINSVLNTIDTAFNEIGYIKDIFDKELSQYAGKIPEYDKLVQNIFNMEKELARQQYLAYGYREQLNQSLDKNNQKVKRLETE